MNVTVSTASNSVSIADSGILASDAMLTRTYDPRLLVRQFGDFHNNVGDFVEVLASSGIVQYNITSDLPSKNGVAILTPLNGTSGSSAAIRSSPVTQSIVLGSEEMRISSKLYLGLSNVGDVAFIRSGFGFYISQGAAASDAAYFRCGTFTGLTTSTNWYCTTIRDGVATNFDTGLPVATPRVLSVEVNAAATSVVFRNNGSVVYTSTTNIPTATSVSGGSMYAGSFLSNNSASAGANRMGIDYMLFDQYVQR